MKTLLKILGAGLACIALVLLILSIRGYEPRGYKPGLWLAGELVTDPVTDWSFSNRYPTVKIQTHPWYLLPHSVTATCVTYNGHLYLTSVYRPGVAFPHGRKWNEDVVRDPRVRIKIGNKLCDRTVSVVTDPAEQASLLQAKTAKYPKPIVAHEDGPVYWFRVQG